MKNLKLTDVVNGTLTSIDGFPLFIALKGIIEDGGCARLSLEGVEALSSSFMNTSFGSLIDQFGALKVKESVILTNYKMRDALYIKNYIEELERIA